MTPIAMLLPCPLLILLVAALRCRIRLLTRFAAVSMWAQLGIAAWFWFPWLKGHAAIIIQDGLRVDTTSAFFVILTTVVSAAALTHAVHFFDGEAASAHPPSDDHIRQAYIFLPAFLLAMYSVVCADNLGYMWIGMEATTLLSAPLVYFHRSRTSLEATWKYLIICSVGIAFGFLGTAMLYSGSQHVGALSGGSLSISTLTHFARRMPAGLMRLGYVFIVLGYGTKAGLFPLHSWLPDAHSEAPAPVSAILSGALLNCALLALARTTALMNAAGLRDVVLVTLLPLGVATVVAGALFLLKQHDIKRLLAYSSMENVGLMATAIAVGSPAGFALQALNHSLVKVALFLLAGNLLQQYGTKKIREIRGLLAATPGQGMLLLLLIIAVAGTPPFGSFLAEWQILTAAFAGRHYATVFAVVVALALAFIALSIQAGEMLFGPARGKSPATLRASTSVPVLLLAGSLVLGVALTPTVIAVLSEVAR